MHFMRNLHSTCNLSINFIYGQYVSFVCVTLSKKEPLIFFTDGELMGGCKPTVQECLDASTECVTSNSYLYGTCVYPTEQVPENFGSGVCRIGLYIRTGFQMSFYDLHFFHNPSRYRLC